MERSVSVNDFGSNARPTVRRDEAESGLDADGLPAGGRRRPLARAIKADQGPCLYLGPAGQRCDRPWLRGFCARHQPGAGRPLRQEFSRVVAAGIGIMAAMWPVLATCCAKCFAGFIRTEVSVVRGDSALTSRQNCRAEIADFRVKFGPCPK